METGKKEVFAAVVLAAGRGKRMESSVHKQYLLLHEKPVLYYALKAFEESPVQEIVLVVGKGEIEYCQKEIVEKYGFQKISHIIEGGAERYHSVYCGLKAIKGADYVLIHDGARPFLDEEIIKRNIQAVREYQACVAGMLVKDTIKVSDEEEFVAATPDRSKLWMIQTPQTFSYELIYQAYRVLITSEENTAEPEQTLPYDSLLNKQKVKKLQENRGQVHVTDDAMVVELLTDIPVKLVRGSYQNIKITTPEDLKIAEALCEKKQ